jgi:hypothetical protein
MSSVCPPDRWVACTRCKRVRSNSGNPIVQFLPLRWKRTEKKNEFVLDAESGRCFELGGICHEKDCSLLDVFGMVAVQVTRPFSAIFKQLAR